MKCKVCGNDRFYGHQVLRADVICDENGNYLEDLMDGLGPSIYDAETHYGPFTCTECGTEYDELEE